MAAKMSNVAPWSARGFGLGVPPIGDPAYSPGAAEAPEPASWSAPEPDGPDGPSGRWGWIRRNKAGVVLVGLIVILLGTCGFTGGQLWTYMGHTAAQPVAATSAKPKVPSASPTTASPSSAPAATSKAPDPAPAKTTAKPAAPAKNDQAAPPPAPAAPKTAAPAAPAPPAAPPAPTPIALSVIDACHNALEWSKPVGPTNTYNITCANDPVDHGMDVDKWCGTAGSSWDGRNWYCGASHKLVDNHICDTFVGGGVWHDTPGDSDGQHFVCTVTTTVQLNRDSLTDFCRSNSRGVAFLAKDVLYCT